MFLAEFGRRHVPSVEINLVRETGYVDRSRIDLSDLAFGPEFIEQPRTPSRRRNHDDAPIGLAHRQHCRDQIVWLESGFFED